MYIFENYQNVSIICKKRKKYQTFDILSNVKIFKLNLI